MKSKLLLYIVCLLLITSCGTQKTIQQETTKNDTLLIYKTDTVEKIRNEIKNVYLYRNDSSEVNKYTNNDTVYIEKTYWHKDIKYIYVDKQDSIKEKQNDSIYQSKNDNQVIVKEQRKSMIDNLKDSLKSIVIYLVFFFGCLLLLKTLKNND